MNNSAMLDESAMNGSANGSLTNPDITKAAAEFLLSGTERRKRSRPNPVPEPPRKKHEGPRKASIEVARKSAIALTRESPAYRRLIDIEQRLDLAIMRKQQDIKEKIKSQFLSEKRTFRLYILNTYRSQPSTPGVTEEDVPSWSIRIQGQLLPKEEAPPLIGPDGHPIPTPAAPLQPLTSAGIPTAQPGTTMPTGPTISGVPGAGASAMGVPGSGAPSVISGPPPKCSDVFSRIVVELDKKLYPENNLIEWKRKDGDPSSDGFEISRAGKTEFTAKIFLYVDHKPEQFKVTHALSKIIGVETETRMGIFSSIWQYVKKHRLQCVDDRTSVLLDDGLKTLLPPTHQHVRTVKLHQLFSIIKGHMSTPEPLMIEYDVKLNGDVVDNQECYDVVVTIQDTSLIESARRAGVFGLSISQTTEYNALNEKHMMALEKLALHKKRRDFFEGFCSNPVQFINHLVLSQTRDLKVLGGGTGRNPEEERRSDFYQQQWVHEAVPRYLLRKAIADTAEETIESGLRQ